MTGCRRNLFEVNKISQRFYENNGFKISGCCGSRFDLNKSAYGGFTVREVSRGESAEEVLRNFGEDIPTPYRVEKFANKRRRGSFTYAMLAEEIHGGVVRASDPASIILVFSPDGDIWIAGFVSEKKDSIIHSLQTLI